MFLRREAVGIPRLGASLELIGGGLLVDVEY